MNILPLLAKMCILSLLCNRSTQNIPLEALFHYRLLAFTSRSGKLVEFVMNGIIVEHLGKRNLLGMNKMIYVRGNHATQSS